MQKRRIVNSLRNIKVNVASIRRSAKSPKTLAGIIVATSVLGTGVAMAATHTVSVETPEGSVKTTVTTPDNTTKEAETTVETSVKGANTSASSSASSNGQSTVTVNGQTVTVPANGTYNKSVQTSGGTMDVSITNNNQGSGSNASTSTTIIQNSTTSTSTSNGTSSNFQFNSGSNTVQ